MPAGGTHNNDPDYDAHAEMQDAGKKIGNVMANAMAVATKEAGKKRKKGTTKTLLTKEEEQQYMVY